MTDSNSQELSDKSLSEFEKELEEAVRGVEVHHASDKTSNVLTASDNNQEILQIGENKITQLMESVTSFENDTNNSVTVETEGNASSNMENVVVTEILHEKVNENGVISTLGTNVNIEIDKINEIPSLEVSLEEQDEFKTTLAENKTSEIIQESVDNDINFSLDNSNEESSSVIEDIVNNGPSSESEVITDEKSLIIEESEVIESSNIEEIENGDIENESTPDATIQNINLQEEVDKHELKEETIHEISHNEAENVVIVKSFLNSTDEGLNIETHHESEIVIINDSAIINTSEENAEITAITESQTLNEHEIQIKYLEDNSVVQEKEDDDVAVENEDSQVFPLENEGIKKIPCHVLGRNVINPSVDIAGKGRVPPKPRLGVKIPYRNLTSQIVSKDEIAEEIMERSRQRNATLQTSKDILFARKLTQRLATKLAAAEISSEKKEHSSAASVKKEPNETISKTEKPSEKKSPTSNNVEKEKISDNSDLLAILEGDDEMEWPETDPNKATSTKSSKTTAQVKSNTQENSHKKQQNENKPESSSNGNSLEGDDFITEPKFSSSLVTKTYTRKRKSSGDMTPTNVTVKKSIATEDKSSVEHKINIDLAPNTYISKSSRIVKKKVIWDPDEAIPMSTFAISKPKVETKQAATVKTSEKKIMKNEKPTSTTVACVKTIPDKKLSPQVAEEKSPKKTPKVTPDKNQVKKVDTQVDKKVEVKASPEKIQPKKSVTLVKKSPFKSKQQNQSSRRRYLTEVEKLLMDEGAVNMLYAVKNTDESENTSNKVKGMKKNEVFSIDNFHQELMDKTNEIKNDLQLNSSKESPKSLRKKDNSIPILKRSEVVGPTGIPLARKKSKDSIRNSTNSPPSSPAYTYTAEASRIIRRHSSSSFSSVGSHTENVNDENKSVNGAGSSPEKSSAKTVKHKVPMTVEGTKPKKIKMTKDHTNSKKQKQKRISKTTASESDDKQEQDDTTTTDDEFQTIIMQKFDNVVQIVFSSPASEHLNEMILDELSAVLTKLGKDDTCTAVILSSSAACFSQGIDYNLLVEENEIQRKSVTEKLAFSVKNFLKSLAIFPKLLVAGINGDAVGLAVTMLPFFDMVFASDTATFSAPYASLGCTPEGGILLASVPNVMHNTLASELFFASRKLNASDALKFGLVTRTLWPDKFQTEVISILQNMPKQSPQGIVSIKKSLRHQLLLNIDELLQIETDTMVELWTSEECQNKFKEYLVNNE